MLRPAGDGEEEPWRAVGLGVSSQRAMPERRKRNPGPPVESNNLNFFIFFPICQKYMSNFFLQKYHHAASSTGGMKVPPDEPAAGAL